MPALPEEMFAKGLVLRKRVVAVGDIFPGHSFAKGFDSQHIDQVRQGR